MKIISEICNNLFFMKINLALFASGAGSNAKKIIEYFKNHPCIDVSLIVCNNPNAGVLKIAEENHIEALLIKKDRFFKGDAYVPQLQKHKTNFIILAGFLWKIPDSIIQSYPEKIINIHPALLPNYGGKGMYGAHVHKAVIENKEAESGITIHLVDEEYDHGRHLFQARCVVAEADLPETLAEKIHVLEHMHFAPVIEKYIKEFTIRQAP